MGFLSRLPRRSIGAQQIMIELANRLDRLFQLLVIAQPPANLVNPIATHAQLPGLAARIAHCHDKDLMAFTARTFWTAARVADRTFKQ
jgi:hypothetical protein